jgi:hypothetical protein
MTEYTTSSHAFREYMSARDRTARWVQSHSPTESEFYSPSFPPSVIDGMIPSSPPSEADSSHSTPPKMVLRYNDGRPDIPIPHPGLGYAMGKQGSKMYRNSPQTSPSRVRSGSSSESPVFVPSSRRDHESSLPEEIRILPSSGEGPISSRPSHVRSKSLPRSSLRQNPPAPDVPFIPPPHLQTQTPYYDQGSTALPKRLLLHIKLILLNLLILGLQDTVTQSIHLPLLCMLLLIVHISRIMPPLPCFTTLHGWGRTG